MPNKQLGMEKIRQMLRCYSQGHGTKSISSMLTVSRNTVKKYLQVFQRSGLDYEGIGLSLRKESRSTSSNCSRRLHLRPVRGALLWSSSATRIAAFSESRS